MEYCCNGCEKEMDFCTFTPNETEDEPPTFCPISGNKCEWS